MNLLHRMFRFYGQWIMLPAQSNLRSSAHCLDQIPRMARARSSLIVLSYVDHEIVLLRIPLFSGQGRTTRKSSILLKPIGTRMCIPLVFDNSCQLGQHSGGPLGFSHV